MTADARGQYSFFVSVIVKLYYCNVMRSHAKRRAQTIAQLEIFTVGENVGVASGERRQQRDVDVVEDVKDGLTTYLTLHLIKRSSERR